MPLSLSTSLHMQVNTTPPHDHAVSDSKQPIAEALRSSLSFVVTTIASRSYLEDLGFNMASIRPRNAKVPFEIHHDTLDSTESLDGEDQVMDESRGDMDEEDAQEDYSSDASDETDEVANPALQEDMIKFQEGFKGIKERFRLIGRIGEGKLI